MIISTLIETAKENKFHFCCALLGVIILIFCLCVGDDAPIQFGIQTQIKIDSK